MYFSLSTASSITIYWAVRMQALPTTLIFSSATRIKNLALTMTRCLVLSA